MLTLFLFMANLPGLGEVKLAPGQIAIFDLDGETAVIATDTRAVAAFQMETGDLIFAKRLKFAMVNVVHNRPVVFAPSLQGLIAFEGSSAFMFKEFFPRFIAESSNGQVYSIPAFNMQPNGENPFVMAPQALAVGGKGLIANVGLDFEKYAWRVGGEWIAPMTEEQHRMDFQFKAFWVVGDSKTGFWLVRQAQNYITLVETNRAIDRDLGLVGWKPFTNDMVIRGTFTVDELKKREQETTWACSRILGAYDFLGGFVICHVNGGRHPESTHITLFDTEWRQLSTRMETGMLIGTDGNTGYFLTPWENGDQAIVSKPLIQ